MTDEQLFKKLSDLEEAYTAGHITMPTYVNEYNKIVDQKRKDEENELGQGRQEESV